MLVFEILEESRDPDAYRCGDFIHQILEQAERAEPSASGTSDNSAYHAEESDYIQADEIKCFEPEIVLRVIEPELNAPDRTGIDRGGA